MDNEKKKLLLEKLEIALFSGHLKVKDGDKEISYNTPEELRRARDTLRAELGQKVKTSKRLFVSYSKGLSE